MSPVHISLHLAVMVFKGKVKGKGKRRFV